LTIAPHANAKIAELGVGRHLWGSPSWLGLRVNESGFFIKPYHQWNALPRDVRRRLAARMPARINPLMAASSGDMLEVYGRACQEDSWRAFATRMLAPFDGPMPTTLPVPHPLADGYGVSLRWTNNDLTSISVFANDRTWLHDGDVSRVWTQGMDPTDRCHYESSLAGLQSIGEMPRHGWHALLSWTVERDGQQHRAASLRVPPSLLRALCDVAPGQ
jgi:hypothetical protein